MSGPFYTNGGPYYLSYDKDTQTCFLNRYFNVPEYTGWDTVSTTWAMGVDLPATGEWTNGFEVVAYSGGGNTPSDKEYKYTVSGAGDADANGNYWATGETVAIPTIFVDVDNEKNFISQRAEYPIYTNGKYYIVPNEGVGQYIIDDAVTPNGAPNYRGPFVNSGTLSGGVCIANTPADGSWEVLGGTAPAPTVTEYAG